jgi:hypothetical protein
VAVSALGEVTTIAAGEEHSLALLSNGAVMAWGQNKEGELGDGSEENSPVPIAVCGAGEKSPCAQHLGEVGAIVAGWGYSLALLKGGTVKAWGGNYEGQLGDGSFSREEPSCSCIRAPVAVSNLSEVGAIAAGDNGTESLALLENGSLMSWGSDRNGALGDANAEGPGGDTDVPVRVCAPDASGPCPQGPYLAGDATAMAVGGDHDLVALNGIGSAPAVLTEAASSITATKATLNASVDPNGSDVSECRLEYATTTSYTSSVACSLPAGSGTDAVAVSASLTGLRANTTYHFRVVARNAVGTSYGSDETFKTLPPAVPNVTTASLPAGRVDSGYSAVLAADEGTTPYTWSLSAGSLPSGLHLNAQSGAIVGTPSAAGTFTFTVKVTDSSTPTQQSATGELSITVSAAVGQAAEYGECKALTNNTTPKVRRGKYADANCQKLFEKRGKPKAKGGFEWAPGPPPTCERQRKGAFTNNTCTARSIQAHRGAFEQEPGAGYTSAGATITLETPGLGVKVVCGQSEGVGEITSQHAGLERFVLFSCETSGKPCNSEGTDGTPSYQPGVIITNLLQTRLIGPASGKVLTQLVSAEHEPYLAEFDCGGARFRTLGSLSGAQSGNANMSSVTSTTTFASGTGEQSIYTELSETEGASWVGPDLSTEATIVTNSAAAKTEIKTT